MPIFRRTKALLLHFGVLFCNKRENVNISREVLFVICYTLPHKKDVTTNIYAFPFVTEQYTRCSNRAFVLLKMGIMMPETC